MNKLLIDFLRALKTNDNVIFIFSGTPISGNVVKFDEDHDCIELSGIMISDTHYNRNITLLVKLITAWGKQSTSAST
jgi:hypothetical protein